MTARDSLLEEIEGVPDPLLAQVLDFLRFLKAQQAHLQPETAGLSEQILAQDWLRPEEEQAWRDL